MQKLLKFARERSITQKVIIITISCFVICAIIIGLIVVNVVQRVSLSQLEKYMMSKKYKVKSINMYSVT